MPNAPSTPTVKAPWEINIVDALVETVSFGVVIIDSGRITHIHADAAEMLGLGIVGQEDLPLEILPSAVSDLLRELKASGKGSLEISMDPAPNGNVTRPVYATALPLEQSSRCSRFALILRAFCVGGKAITTHLQHVDRLARLGTLSAGMAHDAKNALVAVKTCLDLLLERNPDADLGRLARRELGRVDGILSRMLNFAAPSQAASASIHLHEVMDSALDLVQPQLKGKSIAVDRSYQADPDVIQGHDRDLEQAFLNVLLNAAEAMGQSGTLTVETRRLVATTGGASTLQIRIVDTGVGILPEHLERLFQPFFTTKPNGNGLGLAMARRVILEHQGTIAVESQPGRGTTFTIQLPAANASA